MLFRCECGLECYSTVKSIVEYKHIRCKKCHLDNAPSGPDHPSWNSDITDTQRFNGRHQAGDLKWNRIILAANRCIITGDNKGPFSAHHLLSYAKYPESQRDLSNGVCVLRELHRKFHSIYGYKNFTPEDFWIFRGFFKWQ